MLSKLSCDAQTRQRRPPLAITGANAPTCGALVGAGRSGPSWRVARPEIHFTGNRVIGPGAADLVERTDAAILSFVLVGICKPGWRQSRAETAMEGTGGGTPGDLTVMFPVHRWDGCGRNQALFR
jgi:hypothetical protein